jgi:hypothetical protein
MIHCDKHCWHIFYYTDTLIFYQCSECLRLKTRRRPRC